MKKFTVKGTEFHGGNIYSEHNSIKEAIKASKKHKIIGCTCGCTIILCNTPEALKEMRQYEIDMCGYSEIKA